MKAEDTDNRRINNTVSKNQNPEKLNNLLNLNSNSLQDKRSNMKQDYWILALSCKLNKIESMNSQDKINNQLNKQHRLNKQIIKTFKLLNSMNLM